MQVPCPFRGDHKIVRGYMHGPSRCPPPPGEYGEHRRNKRLRKKHTKRAAEFRVDRGAAVAHTGKPSASSDKKAGGGKSKKAATAGNR